MGSKPAPMLANIWLSQFEPDIKGDGEIFFRYMDDILVDVLEGDEMATLNQINNLHPNLKFTIEEIRKENDNEDEIRRIQFLDMELIQKTNGSLESEWYTKETDTGIIMNWFAIAPLRYKSNLVMGFVNRIWSATTNQKVL